MISLILNERRKSAEKGETTYANDIDIIGEIELFALAGTETTSNFITAMILLCF